MVLGLSGMVSSFVLVWLVLTKCVAKAMLEE